MKTTEIFIKELEESAAEHMNEAQTILQAVAGIKGKEIGSYFNNKIFRKQSIIRGAS